MLDSRLKKAAGDLWTNRARSLLVLLAILVGVVGAGVVLDSGAILSRELTKNYLATNPASAVLTIGGSDEAALALARGFPGVEDAELAYETKARIRLGGEEWKTLYLYVLPDYLASRIDLVTSDSGAWPPGPGQLLIERAALSVLGAGQGSAATVGLGLGEGTVLRVAGIAHAPALAPAWMERCVYGWVSMETAALIAPIPEYRYLKITVNDGKLDKGAIAAVAAGLAAGLGKAGIEVDHVEVPTPGEHPHATQMNTLLFLLEAFGLLALALSGILVATMISALLARQTRQIGIMKAIGGSSGQIAAMYFGIVLALGFLAACFALPLSAALARSYSEFVAKTLNFSIFDRSIPLSAYLAELLVALAVPAFAAAYSILRGCGLTVREALAEAGFPDARAGAGSLDRFLGRAAGASRPLLLSLRNAFRRRGRLVLTLATLAAGGAVFMTAMNVQASMDSTALARFSASRFDFAAVLGEARPIRELDSAILGLPGVEAYENWGRANACRILADGRTGNNFTLMAFPERSALQARPVIESGRWFAEGDEDALVVNQRIMSANPDLRIGDNVRLKIGAATSEWRLIGMTNELMAGQVAYATKERFDARTGLAGKAKTIVVKCGDQDPKAVAMVVDRFEKAMKAAGIPVLELRTIATQKEAVRDHFMVIASMLVLMSLLVVVVGILGLSSTMSVNVLERTREIGVMRSIGASSRAIMLMIAAEGLLIGFLSWAAAVCLSWPVSAFLAERFGMIFFEAPLRFAASLPGFLAWLGLAIIASLLASIAPALSATSIPVREAIAWE